MQWTTDIGLEVHVQLKTVSKMFCGCATGVSGTPNRSVCPVCLGYPGAMPVANAKAVELTVRTGMLIDGQINLHSKFDRKNYFYPDMPKNFQITQFDRPLVTGGHVTATVEGHEHVFRITRIHLEEDVAKSNHFGGGSGVDFNRAGTPLMEIVSEPDMHSPDEAMAFLLALKQVLQYGEVSDCNLEEGNIRCDINVSVRPEGQSKLGTKIEIKNMNTFKGVHRALRYEIGRQIRDLERGERIVQETRRWDDEAGRTESMRTKEDAHDYRYFPEPDLPPVDLDPVSVQQWRASLPELPESRRRRFVESYGLPDYDAGVLVADKGVADFFEDVARRSGHAKASSNWVMTDVLRVMAEREGGWASLALTSEALADLVGLVERKVLNMPAAKTVFGELVEKGGRPAEIVSRLGLAQVSDTSAIQSFVDQAMAANPSVVADFKSGKQAALQFLVGQVMKLSRGKANPAMVQELLRSSLGAG